MSKTLIIYHSVQGNTEYVAHTIAKHLNFDTIKINSQQKANNNMIAMTPRILSQMIHKSQFRNRINQETIDSYDTIIFASPCWMYDVSPPVKNVIEQLDLTDKKVSLIMTHGGDIGQSKEKFNDMIHTGSVQIFIDYFMALNQTPDEIINKYEGDCLQ